MKTTIEALLKEALAVIQNSQAQILPAFEIKVERTKDKVHGDFATNIALVIAKSLGITSREAAALLCQSIPPHEAVKRVEIAGPGFINFFVQSIQHQLVIQKILQERSHFGTSESRHDTKILLEYVSSNPTGPLHVGHGRSAAYGASLVNLLRAAGFDITTEYYVNDAGRQMAILAVSVWLRYLEIHHVALTFPSNGYQGDYVTDIAKQVSLTHGITFVHPWDISALPLDAPAGGDKEQHIDAVIGKAKSMLGIESFQVFHQAALNYVLADIKNDLSDFGVTFDQWFSERSLLDSGAIQQGIDALTAAGYTYEEKGALWFASTRCGDEKDRVLVRANGEPTYFASDVAYHWNKLNRGFHQLIDIFGADHHGYIPRLKAAVNALGHDHNNLRILIVQFAVLYRGEERVQMSTRSGSFVTLRELREEVGNDAARFFYVMRKSEQHMDFDLALAKSQSNDNPVYYIQYAHARISSVFRQLEERGFNFDEAVGCANLHLLTNKQETDLINILGRYPDLIIDAAQSCEPHQIAYYLKELAAALHSYYNAVVLLVPEQILRDARLCLLNAVRQVLKNGLQLLGVSAPESM